jgi:hypothetical protein
MLTFLVSTIAIMASEAPHFAMAPELANPDVLNYPG